MSSLANERQGGLKGHRYVADRTNPTIRGTVQKIGSAFVTIYDRMTNSSKSIELQHAMPLTEDEVSDYLEGPSPFDPCPQEIDKRCLEARVARQAMRSEI